MTELPAPEDFLSVSLDHFPRGARGIVIQLDRKLRRIRRLTDLGLVPGASIEIRSRSPFGNLLLLKVMESLISLPESDAQLIRVRAEKPLDK